MSARTPPRPNSRRNGSASRTPRPLKTRARSLKGRSTTHQTSARMEASRPTTASTTSTATPNARASNTCDPPSQRGHLRPPGRRIPHAAPQYDQKPPGVSTRLDVFGANRALQDKSPWMALIPKPLCQLLMRGLRPSPEGPGHERTGLDTVRVSKVAATPSSVPLNLETSGEFGRGSRLTGRWAPD